MSSDMEQKAQERIEGGISENARLCAERDRLAAELAAAKISLQKIVAWANGGIGGYPGEEVASALSSSAASDVEEVLRRAEKMVEAFDKGFYKKEKDFACIECNPHAEKHFVLAGFRCYYHELKRAVRKRKGV